MSPAEDVSFRRPKSPVDAVPVRRAFLGTDGPASAFMGGEGGGRATGRVTGGGGGATTSSCVVEDLIGCSLIALVRFSADGFCLG